MEFNVVDVDASASGFGQDEEEQNEYFMFNANIDDADPEESFWLQKLQKACTTKLSLGNLIAAISTKLLI